jgi:hypothetical protein
MTANNELELIWNKAVLAQLRGLPWHLSEEAGKEHKNPLGTVGVPNWASPFTF